MVKICPIGRPRLNWEEALNVWRSAFPGRYTKAHRTAEREAKRAQHPGGEKQRLGMEIFGVTAEDDCAYNNFYHFLFRLRAGKLTLLKEYKYRLHIYDFLAD